MCPEVTEVLERNETLVATERHEVAFVHTLSTVKEFFPKIKIPS